MLRLLRHCSSIDIEEFGNATVDMIAQVAVNKDFGSRKLSTRQVHVKLIQLLLSHTLDVAEAFEFFLLLAEYLSRGRMKVMLDPESFFRDFKHFLPQTCARPAQ